MNQKKMPKFVVVTLLTFSLLIGSALPLLAKTIHTGMFGLWAYGNWNTAVATLSDNKFEIAVGASTISALDGANQRGIKCLVDFGLTSDIANDNTKWLAFLASATQKVNNLKAHPAVFGWYIVDEPDLQNIPPAKIKQLAALIKTQDKTHPLFTVLNRPDRWKNYLSYFDIVSIDPYLLLSNSTGAPDTPEKVRTMLRQVRRDMKQLKINKPLWVVLGAFDLVPKTSQARALFKKPSPAEFTQMATIAKDEGVDGILVWTLAYKNDPNYQDWIFPQSDPALWDAVRKLPATVN